MTEEFNLSNRIILFGPEEAFIEDTEWILSKDVKAFIELLKESCSSWDDVTYQSITQKIDDLAGPKLTGTAHEVKQ